MLVPEEMPVAGTVVLLREAETTFEVLMIRRPDRGSFPGAWVFPGGKVENVDQVDGAGEAEDARRAGMRETFEEVGLSPQDLVALSRWTPPVQIPKRIRTWFFLATAPEGEVRAAADEVTAYAWLSPAEALQRHAAGEWTLLPPTWMTLHHLLGFDMAAAALAAASDVREFQTRIEGTVFRWDDLRLETARLPWELG